MGCMVASLPTLVCVCDSLIQIDACSENISRKTAQVEEHSKAEGEAKVGSQSATTLTSSFLHNCVSVCNNYTGVYYR